MSCTRLHRVWNILFLYVNADFFNHSNFVCVCVCIYSVLWEPMGDGKRVISLADNHALLWDLQESSTQAKVSLSFTHAVNHGTFTGTHTLYHTIANSLFDNHHIILVISDTHILLPTTAVTTIHFVELHIWESMLSTVIQILCSVSRIKVIHCIYSGTISSFTCSVYYIYTWKSTGQVYVALGTLYPNGVLEHVVLKTKGSEIMVQRL